MANKPGKLSFVAQHKVLTIVSVIGVVIVGIVIYAFAVDYSHKFSKEDYDTLTSRAEAVLTQSGGKDVQVSRTCSYERPAEFSSLHLYCRVAMVSYLPYQNEQSAITMAKTLDREARKLGQPVYLSAPSDFYTKPSNNKMEIFINLSSPYPKAQCSFSIATQQRAKILGIGIPARNENNLIALTFYCAAESRSEYFPVTYRQGQD